MLRAILSLAAALLNALPKLVELARDWKRQQDAARDEAAKNARNEAAIKEAQKALKPGP